MVICCPVVHESPFLICIAWPLQFDNPCKIGFVEPPEETVLGSSPKVPVPEHVVVVGHEAKLTRTSFEIIMLVGEIWAAIL